MRKNLFLFSSLLIVTAQLKAQKDTVFPRPTSKHEFGFSWGAMPTIGVFHSIIGDDYDGMADSDYPFFSHTKYRNSEDGEYRNMYNLGAFTINYQYHFTAKHSMGVSFSWLGRHIDRYEFVNNDTVNGRAWENYFTIQTNYRLTYYQHNITSLYFAIHTGMTLCVRDPRVLYKKKHSYWIGSEGNDKYLGFLAFQLTAFGIDIGRKNVFNLELGLGTQGVIKLGYKFKK